MFTYMFLYPLPLFITGYGVKSESVTIAAFGALCWYIFLGWVGTPIAIAAIGCWWVVYLLGKVLFRF